jgi:hypothetical protein
MLRGQERLLDDARGVHARTNRARRLVLATGRFSKAAIGMRSLAVRRSNPELRSLSDSKYFLCSALERTRK